MNRTNTKTGSVFLALLCTLILFPFALRAQSNLVLLASASGDYIGQGQLNISTNPMDFSVSGTIETIHVGAFGYDLYFTGPGGGAMDVEDFTNAVRWPFMGPNDPGLSVYGNGRGCNTVCGQFQIFELHVDDAGNVDRLWLTFTQICECSMAPLTGEIRFNSQLAPAAPAAKILHVPSEFPSIQQAVQSADLLTADTVVVAPGTYDENINFGGKILTLTSSEGAASTIINAGGGIGVNFVSGETAKSSVIGFTITNASSGVNVSFASPTIASNVIVGSGGGVNVYFGSPTIASNKIIDCTGAAVSLGGAATASIVNNILSGNGGGIYMDAAGSPWIANNLIQGNLGDGLNMVNQCDCDIVQNIIIENLGNGINCLVPSGTRGSYVINNIIAKNAQNGIYTEGFQEQETIANNILAGNPALSVGVFNDTNPPVVEYNDVYSYSGPAYVGSIRDMTGIAGNISADPGFACPPTDDFHLLAGSPCIDAGSNAVPNVQSMDLDGNPRIISGLGHAATVDLGPYEFNPANPPDRCLYVNCPADIMVPTVAGGSSAVVSFPAPTGTFGGTFEAKPASGSLFPAGTNTVTCTAMFGGQIAQCEFSVVVVIPPTFPTNQPRQLTVSAGQTLNLSVPAVGSGLINYTWLLNGLSIPNETNSTLTVVDAQSINEGVYTEIAQNLGGSITSAVMAVRVVPAAPVILTNPVSLSAPASTNVSFSVTALGSEPLAYQWLMNGLPISGATLPELYLTDVQSNAVGSYEVVVSNAVGAITSSVAALTETALAPFFTSQPHGIFALAGAAVNLSALANGSQPIAYQWHLNGTNLPGATANSLSISPLTGASTGAYTLIAANAAGRATSAVAQVNLNPGPGFVQPIGNHIVNVGDTITLAAVVGGDGPFSYIWQYNGNKLSNTNATLTITNIQLTQAGFYRVQVNNRFAASQSQGRVSVFPDAGWVTAWGDDSGGQTNVPHGLNNAVAVAGGDFHSVVLCNDGSITAWGFDGDGQINVPISSLPYVAIAAGAAHNLAIRADGTVAGWGRNDDGQINVPSFPQNVLAIAAGESHSLALTVAGSVIGWGDNSYGQISVPGFASGVSSIAAGQNHSLALLRTGAVVGWGDNTYLQASPPLITNASAIAAGLLHSLALLSNGTVIAWGDDTYGQTNVPTTLSNVVAIAAGDFHSVAVKDNGEVVAWGSDLYGQLDFPTTLDGVSGIACGNYHSLAIQPSALQVKPLPDILTIHWQGPGILQSATNPNGPYADVPSSGHSYTNINFAAPQRFFRLRH
jgi:parallel beta-helix repeat protein